MSRVYFCLTHSSQSTSSLRVFVECMICFLLLVLRKRTCSRLKQTRCEVSQKLKNLKKIKLNGRFRIIVVMLHLQFLLNLCIQRTPQTSFFFSVTQVRLDLDCLASWPFTNFLFSIHPDSSHTSGIFLLSVSVSDILTGYSGRSARPRVETAR